MKKALERICPYRNPDGLPFHVLMWVQSSSSPVPWKAYRLQYSKYRGLGDLGLPYCWLLNTDYTIKGESLALFRRIYPRYRLPIPHSDTNALMADLVFALSAA